MFSKGAILLRHQSSPRLRPARGYGGTGKAVVVNGEGSGEYFRIVADYIHLNPVRSGWVGGTTRRKLASWRWSSFSQYAGGRGYPWLETAKVLEAFRLDQGARGHRAYARYLEKRAADREATLTDESLLALRQGWFLGEDAFRDRILNALTRKKPAKQTKRASLGGAAARSYDEAEARSLIDRLQRVWGSTRLLRDSKEEAGGLRRRRFWHGW